MFDDFDSMDMYGFLDYLEESTSLDNVNNDINLLEESLGIYEDLNGDLQIEENFLFDTMDKHNLTEDEAIFLIMEAFEEELSLLLGENVDSDLSAAEAELEQAKKDQEEKRKAHEEHEKSQANYTNNVSNSTTIAKDHQEKLKQPHSKKDLAKNFAKGVGVGAASAAAGGAAGAALGAGAVGAHMMYKAHKAKKEAEARRKRGLMGKIRRLREDYGIFEDEYGQLFIEDELVEYVEDYLGIYSEDFIDSTLECYLEDLNDIIDGTLFDEDIDMILEAKNGRGMGGKPRQLVTAQTTNFSSNHSSGGSGGSKSYFPAETAQQRAARILAQRKGKSVDKTDKAENIVNNPVAQSYEEPKNPEIDHTQAGEQTVEQRQRGKGKRSHRAPKDYTVKKYSNGTKKLSRKQKKAIAKAQANGQQNSSNSNTEKTQITTTSAKPLNNNNTPKEVKEIVQQRFEDNNMQTPQQRKEEKQQKVVDPKPKDDSAYQPSTYVPRQSQEQIQQGAKEQQLERIKTQIKNTKDETDKIPTVDTKETENNNEKANIHRANNNLTQINNAKDVMARYERRQKMARAAGVAVGGAAVIAGGHLAHKAYKQHKARKEEEARRNRGLRGKLRRLREGEEFMLEEKYGIFENEYGELFIESEMVEYVMDEYDLYEEDAIDLIMECYEEELLAENVFKSGKKYLDARKQYTAAEMHAQNMKDNGSDEDHEEAMDYLYDRQKYLTHSKDKFAKDATREVGGAVLAAGGVAAAGALAHKAYKGHKAKKEAEARRNRGLRGKLRRLREDYGIFEDEYGQLFIESEMIESVMDEYDLYEEEAIDIIMESYEEELDELLYENAAQEVVAASHHQVSVEADRQLRQAEMDEGDADRNLARGGKHILNGIRRAPRSEQDQAGEAGVRFKNRVDDGDMDGEFIDSGIQKPMGSGRRIAEDSDMGF